LMFGDRRTFPYAPTNWKDKPYDSCKFLWKIRNYFLRLQGL
jgi:hypothetical protein